MFGRRVSKRDLSAQIITIFKLIKTETLDFRKHSIVHLPQDWCSNISSAPLSGWIRQILQQNDLWPEGGQAAKTGGQTLGKKEGRTFLLQSTVWRSHIWKTQTFSGTLRNLKVSFEKSQSIFWTPHLLQTPWRSDVPTEGWFEENHPWCSYMDKHSFFICQSSRRGWTKDGGETRRTLPVLCLGGGGKVFLCSSSTRAGSSGNPSGLQELMPMDSRSMQVLTSASLELWPLLSAELLFVFHCWLHSNHWLLSESSSSSVAAERVSFAVFV